MSVRRPASRTGTASQGSLRNHPAKGGAALVTALPAVLDLTAAGPLAAEFLCHRGAALTVDASAVERLGAQCLQVLLAARNAWAADGQNFCIGTPSEALRDAVAAMGAAEILFPLPEERPA